MFNTPCALCVFCKREEKACLAGEFCVQAGDTMVAPGFCRIFRTAKWAQAKLENDPHADLARMALQEVDLKWDLMVYLDLRKHSIDHLRCTLKAMPDYENLIVADATGGTGRPAVVEAVNDAAGDRPFKVESFVESIDDIHETIWRTARLVQMPYFAVIEAGRWIEGLNELRRRSAQRTSRVVHRHFPVVMGNTETVCPRNGYGVYLTDAYRQIGHDPARSFFDRLAEYEHSTGWSLTCLSERGVVI